MTAPAATLLDEGFIRKLDRLLILAKRLRGRPAGRQPARHAGRGTDFADHRPYTPGDDPRHLDWNLFARLGRPFVRTFEEDEARPLYLLLDVSASMGEGPGSKLALGLQLVSALAYVGLHGQDSVLVSLLDAKGAAERGPLRGRASALPLLRELSAVVPRGATDLAGSIDRFLSRRRRPGTAVVISDYFDARGHVEALDRLRFERHRPVALALADRRDAHAPDGPAILIDVERRTSLRADVDENLRRDARAARDACLSTLRSYGRQRAVPVFDAFTDETCESVVLRMFRGRRLAA